MADVKCPMRIQHVMIYDRALEYSCSISTKLFRFSLLNIKGIMPADARNLSYAHNSDRIFSCEFLNFSLRNDTVA